MKTLLKKIRQKWHNDIINEGRNLHNDAIKAQNPREIILSQYDISHFVNGKTWYGSYSSFDDYIHDDIVFEYSKKIDTIFNNFVKSPNIPSLFTLYCEVCGHINSIQPHYIGAKTENFLCACLMNSRMRAMYEYIKANPPPPPPRGLVYISERITPSYLAYERYFGKENIVGSEYIGDDKVCGNYYNFYGQKIMHQDCTRLSFSDNTFNVVISQQVFEHIFNYQAALKECFRILKPNGLCVISIPFYDNSAESVMIAKPKGDGEIEYIYPPEIHGNLLDSNGSLCFWHHGWEFVEVMKTIGFDANVHFYNNVYKGYWGAQSLITGIKN